jgi:hypothetical protein
VPMDNNDFSIPRMLEGRQTLFRRDSCLGEGFSTTWVYKYLANKLHTVRPNIFSIIMTNDFPLRTKM